MENVVRDQVVALWQHFPYISSKFSKNAKCHTKLLLNLAIMLFSISVNQYNPFDHLHTLHSSVLGFNKKTYKLYFLEA